MMSDRLLPPMVFLTCWEQPPVPIQIVWRRPWTLCDPRPLLEYSLSNLFLGFIILMILCHESHGFSLDIIGFLDFRHVGYLSTESDPNFGSTQVLCWHPNSTGAGIAYGTSGWLSPWVKKSPAFGPLFL